MLYILKLSQARSCLRIKAKALTTTTKLLTVVHGPPRTHKTRTSTVDVISLLFPSLVLLIDNTAPFLLESLRDVCPLQK